ncbi:MAG: patatin-like phospholipase family protein [Hyphomonadaceae bacterium]
MRVKAAVLVSAAALAGCITPPRTAEPALAATLNAVLPGFPPTIRTGAEDPRLLDNNASAERARLARAAAAADGTFDVLALSGGGAGGAYGAGVLVGLTRAGERPQYEIVTGVSTGALIAPFAFLGSDWDDELEAAYTGELAANLLRRRGLSILSEPGLYDGRPLHDLVDHNVTLDLIHAVAREYARGRLLLVATTNLDTQDTVIWDMGAIASRGDEEARALFRDVLIASASVPGVFPPVMINVDANGAARQEMHVDGGVSTPFFVTPQIMSLWRDPASTLRGGRIFVIVNGQLEARASQTRLNTVSIAARSFETNMMFQSRQNMILAAGFAERNGLALQFARIAPDYDYRGSMGFGLDTLRGLFDYGYREAQAGRVWITPEESLRRERRAER